MNDHINRLCHRYRIMTLENIASHIDTSRALADQKLTKNMWSAPGV